MKKITGLLMAVVMVAVACVADAAEEMTYRQFRFTDVTCDVGLYYRKTPGGMLVEVSAIAFGRGAEFRKWKIRSIKLDIGGKRIKPTKATKFFVTKENLWKYPSAVLFAVIGAQIPASGSETTKAITRIGAAAGLGLLTLQAQGDIGGSHCTFDLDSRDADRIIEGVDSVIIVVEHPDLHKKERIRMGLARSPAARVTCEECPRMSSEELKSMTDELEGRVKALEAEQSSYRAGEDPQFDILQREIDALQTKRGIAHRTWLERGERE